MKVKAYCRDSRGKLRAWEVGDGQFSKEDVQSTFQYLNSASGRVDLYKVLEVRDRSVLKTPVLMCISM